MERVMLKKMRMKQFLVTNVLILTLMTTYFILISVLDITNTQLFLVLGVLMDQFDIGNLARTSY
jgi:hypothetical protein